MGSVNVGAAEQCRRLAERQEFLIDQERDLAASESALQASAVELQREIEARFLRSFAEIRERFSTVFTDLFGGGRADLVLTDADQPLTSGIEVLAQPPGKRMSSLALLSGGERALTAIALLFAVLGKSKTGFCVLDEVDAYLDEPNCVRFSRYLRSLAGDRQFLVVSHSKTTMEAADVLYGLTMEEDGVSRMISVRLAEPVANGRAD
jgi:chromosome segregation protein